MRGECLERVFLVGVFQGDTRSSDASFGPLILEAMRSKLESVKKVVKVLRRHEEGLLNYSQHGISNACAEGFNSAIKLIKANAHGLRNFTNYRARI